MRADKLGNKFEQIRVNLKTLTDFLKLDWAALSMTVHYQRALTRNLYVRDHKVINRSSAGSIMEFQNKSEFVMGLFGQTYSWMLDKIHRNTVYHHV